LEAQLLREVVAQERGELEEAKERLLLSLAADTRQLQDLQDRILKLLKVTPPSVVLLLAKNTAECTIKGANAEMQSLESFWRLLLLVMFASVFVVLLKSWAGSHCWYRARTMLNSLPM